MVGRCISYWECLFSGAMLVSGSVPSLEQSLPFPRPMILFGHFAGSLPRGCQLCHFFPLGAVRSILGRSRAAAPSDSYIICDSISQWLFWGVKYRSTILQLDFIQLPLFLFVFLASLHFILISMLSKKLFQVPPVAVGLCSFLHSRLLARARPVMSDERLQHVLNLKSDFTQPKIEAYCWWKKSQATWDV